MLTLHSTALLATQFCIAGSPATPPSYHGVVLPQIDDTASKFKLTYTTPFALNDSREVTGSLGNGLGFVWSMTEGGSFLQPLFAFAADGAVGTGINNSSVICGSYTPIGDFFLHPFMLTPDGTFTPLETVEDGLAGGAADINDSGMVVGSVELEQGGPFGGPNAAAYWLNGELHQIGGLGGESAIAIAVNNQGVVAGYSNTLAMQAVQPFKWTEAGGFDVLPQLVAGVPAAPNDINDNNLVVGSAGVTLFETRAAYWDPSGSIHPLPSLETNSFETSVMAVNNDGIMVGFEVLESFEWEARLWLDEVGYNLQDLVTDLDDNTYHLRRAVDINAEGVIATEASTTVAGQTQFVTILLVPLGCSADLGGEGGSGADGTVNLFDLLELLANWGTDGPGASLADPDDVVNLFDLLELLASWGPCA